MQIRTYIRPNRFPVGLRLLISTVRLRLSVERRKEAMWGEWVTREP